MAAKPPLRLRHLVSSGLRNRRGYARHTIFRDPAVQRGLARYGYHVTPPLLSAERIAELRAACEEWLAMAPPRADGAFHSSYAATPTPASLFARGRVNDLLLPSIASLVHEDQARLSPSVFQVKPPSPASGLRSHQDSFLVDEAESFGVFAWAALTDVAADDGALIVVPGSHRFARWHRVSTSTDDFEGLHEAIERHARVLEVDAGQVVLFDNATIHGSLANRSKGTRLAVSAVIVPRASDLLIPLPVDGPRPASTALYRLDPDAPTGRDAPSLLDGEHLGEVQLDHLRVSPRGFSAVCRLQGLLRPGAPGTRIPPGRSAR